MRLKARRVMAMFGMVGMAGLIVAGCGGGGDPIVAPKPDALSGLTATISNSTLIIGATATISPTATKGDASASVAFDYSSSASGIASVTASGVVTAVSAGTATITVTANGSGTCCTSNSKTATVSVTVSAPQPALTGTLTVAPNPASVNVGSTVTLVPNPTKASAAVVVANTFVSSSTSTAQVDGAGVVTGVAPGQAVVTVTSTGSGAGFATTVQTAVVTINVAALPPALTGTMTVTPSSSTLTVDATQDLAPNVTKAAAAVTVSYTYVSSNLTVATMSGSTVRAVSPGTSNITVTATGSGAGYSTTVQTAIVGVTVQAGAPAIGNLTLTTTNGAIVLMGNTTKIVPNANPAPGAVVVFTYVSGTPATAQVANDGTITTVAPGTTTVTVTAVGSGTGLATTTKVTTILITVLAAPCSIIDRTLDFATTGSITATDCLFQGGPGVADYFRVTPTAQATVIRLDALASGFTSVAVVAHTSTNPVSPLFFTGTTAAQGTFLLPPGISFLGVISRTGVFGNYSATATVLPEDVAACRTVVIFATVTTTQRLSAESCLPLTGSIRFDSFAILAPGRSCTIDMLLPLAGTTAPLMDDPFLEAWRGDGTAKIAENDDIVPGSNVESRITFNNCVDPVGNFIEIRARAFTDAGTPAQLGAYRLRITFGP